MAVKHTIIQKDEKHRTLMLTRGSAIRQKCLECCAWHTTEVRECGSEDCALWPYRMGSETKSMRKKSE
jgi:hypothetical protein